ncbi:MAG: hypothetical protein HY815_13410, partial [Candidatus Riflebacteria bacterium]|nr:hypothetical protein [Candidatus Riflebacteria bacterium]
MDAELALSPQKTAFLEAQVAPYLTGQESLVSPPCRYFDLCGGCHLQHLESRDQLAFKVRLLKDVFAACGVTVPDLEGNVHGMRDPWYYRNKTDFNSKVYGGQVRIGFTELGASRVLDIEHCLIASRPINDCLVGFKKALLLFPELKRKLHSVILRSSHRDET